MTIMKSVETEGKTVEDAVQKACEQLGASREDLEIEVLANSSSGFLGIGAKKAQIRATVRETAPRKTAAAPAGKEPVRQTPGGNEEIIENARKTLQELLARLDITVEIESREEPERILLNIKGDGSGILIGRKGQTLDALEYLINKIVHRGAEDRKRITLDTENYRTRREESLRQLARRLAEKAKKQGRPVTISPMNAHDRRVVHLALQEDKTLRTRSTGTGAYRRLIITPEKKSSP
jgi:spoIIIJ-associated protein